ncbi:hypothetical protein [Achromobacter spanius]
MSLLFFGVNLRWQAAFAAKNQRAAVMLLWDLVGLRAAIFSEYKNGFRWIAVRAINSIDQFKD